MNEFLAGWRSTELAIIGGCAHSLNGCLTGLLLAAELGRLDDRLPAEALDVIEQQSSRINAEISILLTLRGLDSESVELHDPLQLARTAITLFQRLPVAARAAARTFATPEVVPVDVAGGPCIRALVLCLQAIAGSVPEAGGEVIDLRVSRRDPDVMIDIVSAHSGVLVNSLASASEAVLDMEAGARLVTLKGTPTLVLRTPH